MKIPINLASQPFRRDRAMMVGSLAVSALLLTTLGILSYLAMVDNSQLAVLRRDNAQLDRRIASSTADQVKLEAILHKPENASVLERTVFINDLLYHKGVSWSQILEDLEKTVPLTVKVLMLHPNVNNNNQVQLDLSVGSESPDALVTLLKNLEASPMFGEVYERTQQFPTQSEPLHRMRITVNYAHKL